MTSATMPTSSEAPFTLAMKPRPTAESLRRSREHRRHRALLLLTDGAALSLIGAAAVSGLAAGGAAPVGPLVAAGAAMTVLHLISLGVVRTRGQGITASREIRRVLLAGGLTFAVVACWVAFAPSATLRSVLLAAVPAGAVAVVVLRLAWRRWASAHRDPLAPRAVVVGPRRLLDTLVPALQTGRLGYHVVGLTVEGPQPAERDLRAGDAPILGPASATADVARAVNAEVVIVAGATHDPDFVRRLSWQLEGSAASLVLATPLTDVAAGRMSVDTSAGLALVGVRIPTYDGASYRIKRLLDVVCSIVALVPILCVAPFIALAIRLDSTGPVLFRQRRVGCDGREFDMLKFRTMRVGAEHEVDRLTSQNEADGALFKVKRDPRVTRVGRLLRKYSIDELPQFWNVLRGEMSIVGPRPPLPREVRSYDVPVFRRLYLRPGITGPWQIGGRSDLSWEESVRLDLHYVENWSVARDLAIMIRTAAVVLRAKGAY